MIAFFRTLFLILTQPIFSAIPDPYQSYDEYQSFTTTYLYLSTDIHTCMKYMIIVVLEDIGTTSLLFSIYKFNIRIQRDKERNVTRECVYNYGCRGLREMLIHKYFDFYCYKDFEPYPPFEKEISNRLRNITVDVYGTGVRFDFTKRHFGVKMPDITSTIGHSDTVFHYDNTSKFVSIDIYYRKLNFLYVLEVKLRLLFPIPDRELGNRLFKGYLNKETSPFEDLSIELSFNQQELLFVENDFSYFYLIFHQNKNFLKISFFTGSLRLADKFTSFSDIKNFDEIDVDSLTVIKRAEKMELGSQVTIRNSVLGYLRLAASKLVLEGNQLRGFCKMNKFIIEDCSNATFNQLANVFATQSTFAKKVKNKVEIILAEQEKVLSEVCKNEQREINEKGKEKLVVNKILEKKKEEFEKISSKFTGNKEILAEFEKEYESHKRRKKNIADKMIELQKEKTEIKKKKEEKLTMKEKNEKEKQERLIQLQKKVKVLKEEATSNFSKIEVLQNKINKQKIYFFVLLGLFGFIWLIDIVLCIKTYLLFK